jgi:hypothetical protein
MGRCGLGVLLAGLLQVSAAAVLQSTEICDEHPPRPSPQLPTAVAPAAIGPATSLAQAGLGGAGAAEAGAVEGLEVALTPADGGGVCDKTSTDRGRAAAAVGAIKVQGQLTCSGVLVAPSTVITAAHCIYGKDRATLEFVVGDDANGVPRQRAPVLDFGWHRDYDPSRLGVNDLGYLHLARAISAVTPATYSRIPLYDRFYRKQLFMYVGYGVAGPLAGQRRCVDIPVAAVCEGAFANAAPGLATCRGDSGGGVFFDDPSGYRLFGIITWGDDDCNAYGVSADVGSYQDWIGRVINAAAVVPPAQYNLKAEDYAKPPDNAGAIAAKLEGTEPRKRRGAFNANYRGRWVRWEGRLTGLATGTQYGGDFCDVELAPRPQLLVQLTALEGGCGLDPNEKVSFRGSLDEYESHYFGVIYPEKLAEAPERPAPVEAGDYELVAIEKSEAVSSERRSRDFKLESDPGQWRGRVESCVRISVEPPWTVDREVPIKIVVYASEHGGVIEPQPRDLSEAGFCVPLWAEGVGGTDAASGAGSRGVASGYVEFGTVRRTEIRREHEVATGKVFADLPLKLVVPDPTKRYELRLHMLDGRDITAEKALKVEGVDVTWDTAAGAIKLQVSGGGGAKTAAGKGNEAGTAATGTLSPGGNDVAKGDATPAGAGAPGTFSGTVVSEDGQPLSGATVRVAASGEAAVTDAGGRFSVSAPAGVYIPTFTKLGYVSATSAPIVLATGGSVEAGTIRLAPAPGGITGSVVSASDGSALAGAVVSLAEKRDVATTTDASGNFALTEAAGTYTVTIAMPGYVSRSLPPVALAAGEVQALGKIVLTASPAGGPGTASSRGSRGVEVPFRLPVPELRQP